MAIVNAFGAVEPRALDSNGDTLSGALLYFFEDGTTTPVTTFSDEGGTTPNAHPIVADAAGAFPPVFIEEGEYRVDIRTAANVSIGGYPRDDVQIGGGIGARFYTTRAAAVADISALASLATGTIVDAGGVRYVKVASSSIIPDLPNFEPAGEFTPEHWGCIGDGTTNDRDNMLAAMSGATGRTLTGNGKTYRVDTPISPTSENITIRDMVLDMSNMGDQPGSFDFGINFAGTQGTGNPLTADTAAGSATVAIADTTGFVADGYAFLSSNDDWDTGTSTKLGIIVQVKSVDSGTQLTLYENTPYDFLTADSAQIAVLTMKTGIRLERVNMVMSGANNSAGFQFHTCADVTMTDCHSKYGHYAFAGIGKCANVSIENCSARFARSTGLSYGFVLFDAGYSIRINGCYGEDLRHLVTTGGTDGVIRFVNVQGCHAARCREAGIDSHAACDEMVITGNTVEADAATTDHDGIIFQGANCVVSDNIVRGFDRHSIFVQHQPDVGTMSCVVTGNNIMDGGGSAGTDVGINISNETATRVLKNCVIANNVINSPQEFGIFVYATGGDVENISITGNQVIGATQEALLLRADAAFEITRATISGNILQGSAVADPGISLLGTTAPNIFNVSITGNVANGFAFGLRAIQVDGLYEAGNRFLNFATDPYEIQTNCTNIHLTPDVYGNPQTVTNATFTVEEDDTDLVCDRAGAVTLTLPDPTVFPAKRLNIKTVQAQTVVSASSNVVPAAGGAAGTAIIPATAGAWAALQSNGTNWEIMQEG